MRPPGPYLSLRTKITTLVALVTLVATAAVGMANYLQSAQMARANGMASLTAESRVVSTRVNDFFRTARSNAAIVGVTPPIEGLARAGANGGIDPFDGSSTALWKARLETIFSALMTAHPEYTQVRLVGLDDNGRELVRVNRTPSGLERVTEADLQPKGDEPYFRTGARLAPGEIFISPVSPNREHGTVEDSLTPTVRTVLPLSVFDDQRFGMLVINADFEYLVRQALTEIGPRYRTILATGSGHYAIYEPGEGMADPQFSFEPAYQTHPVLAPDYAGESEIIIDGFSYAAQDVGIESGRDGLELAVLVGRPTVEIMQAAFDLRQQSFIVGLVLVAASVLAAILLADGLTKPLRSMAHSVRQFGRTRTALTELPVGSEDEIGDLARAFTDMTRDLETSELTMKSVVDSIDDGLIVIDDSNTIRSVNPATARIFGFPEDELVGADAGQLISATFDADADGAATLALRSGDTACSPPVERDGKRRDGTSVPLEVGISEIQLEGTRFRSALVRDISVRKQMETMKDEFVSTVNHELRTPLTSIHGSLSLLKRKLEGSLDEKSDHLLSMAQNSCGRLTSLVNDILDLEKMALGKVDYRFEILPADALVADVVQRHLGLADQYGVTFDLHMDARDVAIRVDPNRFNQALVNLLSNAAKYSPSGGTVAIRTGVDTDNRLRVSVADDGPGIPEGFRDKVFERFAQADSSTTRRVGGTGLGLNITQTLIEAFGGEVCFDTEIDRGTTFHFLLPIARRTAGTQPAGASPAHIS